MEGELIMEGKTSRVKGQQLVVELNGENDFGVEFLGGKAIL